MKYIKKTIVTCIALVMVITSLCGINIAYAEVLNGLHINWPVDDEKIITGSTINYNPEIILDGDFAYLEYLETNGTQYFDTGIQSARNIIEVNIEYDTSSSSGTASLFGAYNDSNAINGWGIDCDFDNDTLYVNYGLHQDVGNIPNEAIIDLCQNKLYVNNDSSTPNYTIGTFDDYSITNNLYLFAKNENGSAVGKFSGKLYYANVFEDGNYVRKFVPVVTLKDLDASNNIDDTTPIPAYTVCLYDEISEKYFLSNGNNPIIGPLTFSFYDESGEEIYSILDYIESDGTQYIDIDMPNFDYSDWAINTRMFVIDKSSNPILFGAQQSNTFSLNSANNDIGVTQGSSGTILSDKLIMNDWMDVYYESTEGSQYINYSDLTGTTPADEGTTTLSGASVSDTSPYIFGVNNSGSPSSLMKCKIRFLQIYKNGNMVLDLIPAKRLSDGKIGFIDSFNSKFYTNSSGNDFSFGVETDPQKLLYSIGGEKSASAVGEYTVFVDITPVGLLIYNGTDSSGNYTSIYHTWKISNYEYNPVFNAYNGVYDGNNHPLSLVNVLDQKGNLIDSSNYTIKYSLDSGATYDKDINDINTAYSNFKELGSYSIYYKILPAGSNQSVYNEKEGIVNINILNHTNNDSKYKFPKTCVK